MSNVRFSVVHWVWTLTCHACVLTLASWFVLTIEMPSISDVVLFPCVVVSCTGFGMSAILHRFFSHQAYKTSSAFTVVLLILGSLTNQQSPLWWASKHNRHHKYCDTPRDPHSWSQTNAMYAWIGWTVYEYKIDWQFVPKRVRTNTLFCVVNALHPVWYGLFVWGLSHGIGQSKTFWWYVLPTFLVNLGTLRFNLIAHPKENTNTNNTPEKCKATKVPIRLPIFIGESHHKDHHKYPRKAHRPGFDGPYYCMLAPLEMVGIIWDLQH